MCDDVERTVADLKARGAAFEGGIEERASGRGITLIVPGAGAMFL